MRALFAATPEAKIRGYQQGRFSFNVKGGRCEACAGDGTIKIEMHFLPDVYVPCEVCKGARYNRDTLDITFKGKNIAEILDLSCEEGVEFFENQPAIARWLQTLVDVGLGYVRLGQPAPTLSGGEAQRVKLATELGKRSTGRTIYILDEPTTGLHFEDVRRLLGVLQRLVDVGNTILVIEHNLDVIKSADWIIDLGPEGGDGGGKVIAEGPPEHVAKTAGSYTGEFLAPMLAASRRVDRTERADDAATTPWEAHAQWWQDEFTDGADPEYVEQILPIVASSSATARTCSTSAPVRVSSPATCRAVGVGRVTGIDPSVNQLRDARAHAAEGPRTHAATAAALPFADATLRRRGRVPRVRAHRRGRRRDRRGRPGARTGRGVPVPPEPPAAPGARTAAGSTTTSSRSSTGGSARTSIESLEEEEIAPGVHLPFIHRPMSRYVNALAANGLLRRTACSSPRHPRVSWPGRSNTPARRRSRGCWSCARSVTELALRPEPGNADVPGMRRSARVLVLVGTVGAVFGLAKLHALTHTYDITDSGRLGWSLAYVGVLLVAAYAVGLPSLPAQPEQAAGLRRWRRARRDPDVGRDPRGRRPAPPAVRDLRRRGRGHPVVRARGHGRGGRSAAGRGARSRHRRRRRRRGRPAPHRARGRSGATGGRGRRVRHRVDDRDRSRAAAGRPRATPPARRSWC